MQFYNNRKFKWDENKFKDNVRKHKVSFYEAETVFNSSYLPKIDFDDTHSQNEERYKITGYSNRDRLLVVVYAERGDVIRIISARKANKSEKELYDENFSQHIPFG